MAPASRERKRNTPVGLLRDLDTQHRLACACAQLSDLPLQPIVPLPQVADRLDVFVLCPLVLPPTGHLPLLPSSQFLQFAALRKEGEFHAGVQAELVADGDEVVLDRLQRDVPEQGDLLVHQAVGDVGQQFAFSRSQETHHGENAASTVPPSQFITRYRYQSPARSSRNISSFVVGVITV